MKVRDEGDLQISTHVTSVFVTKPKFAFDFPSASVCTCVQVYVRVCVCACVSVRPNGVCVPARLFGPGAFQSGTGLTARQARYSLFWCN